MKFWICICLIFTIWFWNPTDTIAGQLANRLENFPQWYGKPPVKIASGDLIYPEWMSGTWEVKSTLVDLVAPLAPKIVTPGFEGNRRYLNQSVSFPVRFTSKYFSTSLGFPFSSIIGKPSVVADRAFNGLKIAQAYLGNEAVLSVKVDPKNPNRQISFFPQEQQLISTVTGRSSEILAVDKFVATEVTQQIFEGKSQIYINEVETTTAYQHLNSKIIADQVTAIYLSPQDPDYFVAGDRPVALYRYKLELSGIKE